MAFPTTDVLFLLMVMLWFRADNLADAIAAAVAAALGCREYHHPI